VQMLTTKWREGGLPPAVLAEALIELGSVQLVQTRGPARAAEVLAELLTQLSPGQEVAARRRRATAA
jgi:hypothetical protein